MFLKCFTINVTIYCSFFHNPLSNIKYWLGEDIDFGFSISKFEHLCRKPTFILILWFSFIFDFFGRRAAQLTRMIWEFRFPGSWVALNRNLSSSPQKIEVGISLYTFNLLTITQNAKKLCNTEFLVVESFCSLLCAAACIIIQILVYFLSLHLISSCFCSRCLTK